MESAGVYITWMCPRADARATTLRWDLTSKQAALTKQNRAVCLDASLLALFFKLCAFFKEGDLKQEETGGTRNQVMLTKQNRAVCLLVSAFLQTFFHSALPSNGGLETKENRRKQEETGGLDQETGDTDKTEKSSF